MVWEIASLAWYSALQACPQCSQRQPTWWTQQISHCSEAGCSLTHPCHTRVLPSRRQGALLSLLAVTHQYTYWALDGALALHLRDFLWPLQHLLQGKELSHLWKVLLAPVPLSGQQLAYLQLPMPLLPPLPPLPLQNGAPWIQAPEFHGHVLVTKDWEIFNASLS